MTMETTKLARVIYKAANGSVRKGAERLTMAAAERIARSVREPVLDSDRAKGLVDLISRQYATPGESRSSVRASRPERTCQ
jgi:hypothetical protein